MLDTENLLEMTSDIITSMVANNSVPPQELPSAIASVYAALSGLGQEQITAQQEERPSPAVTARRSLAAPNQLISMIDGKAYSSLKRHITRHGYTPDSYRDAFGLKSDYPMIAPGYSERRRELAKKIGLGRKATAVAPDVPTVAELPPKKARKPRQTKAQSNSSAVE